jgi:integrase
MPVKEIYAEYLESDNWADSTIDSKKTAIKDFPNIDITEVAYSHAEAYKKMLWQGDRGAKTVNLYVKHLKHFFEWCIDKNYLAENPFKKLRLSPEIDRKMPVFEDDELIRMFNVSSLPWKVLMCFGLKGLRLGEALNLLWTDLNFDKQYLMITPKKDTEQTWRWGIKNHTQAYVPLPEQIELPDMVIPFHLLLYEHHKKQRIPYVNVKPAVYYKMMTADKIHYRQRLNPWSSNFDRDFKALLKRADVTPKSFHDLRRTYGRHLKEKKFDLAERQAALRHKSIATTAKYYETIDERELVSRINRAFSTL